MKKRHIALIASAAALMLAESAFAAGPPAGVTTGPPPFVTMGPPPHALTHIPAGVAVGKPSLGLTGTGSAQGLAANELGKLNAAHASPVALQHAAPSSSVGVIANYQDQMDDALALVDPAQRDAAITAARQELALSSNKQLTPSAASRIDGMLGITGASPDLGTTP
jgi:hypothetical protein